MTMTVTAALAMLTGVLIGAGSVMTTPAQVEKTAPGYVIAEVDVHDPATMQKYGEKVPETLAPFHHQYLVRSRKILTLEGAPPEGGIVEIQFDSVEKAREWYNSPAYAAIRPVRQQAATSRIFIVEGVLPQ